MDKLFPFHDLSPQVKRKEKTVEEEEEKRKSWPLSLSPLVIIIIIGIFLSCRDGTIQKKVKADVFPYYLYFQFILRTLGCCLFFSSFLFFATHPVVSPNSFFWR